MRGPDLDRERSEKVLTMKEFMGAYNENLPTDYPVATSALLKIFQEDYPHLFKKEEQWTLDQHRKRVMDWLPVYLRRGSAA